MKIDSKHFGLIFAVIMSSFMSGVMSLFNLLIKFGFDKKILLMYPLTWIRSAVIASVISYFMAPKFQRLVKNILK